MTREQGNSLPTGEEGRKAPITSRDADQKLEEDIIISEDSGGWNGDIGIMDTAVIAMVNLYLKNIPLSERCKILESVVHFPAVSTTVSSVQESGERIRAHIDGAKLADLIDKAKAYLAELLNVRRTAHSAHSASSAYSYPHEEQPERSVETVSGTVIGVDMSNKNCGMINTAEYDYYSSDGVDTETAGPAAKLKGRVVSVDDIDDDGPKYNPELEMSFNNLINKSWMVLFDLMRGLSGSEYVTHMPYEMAEMIVKHYYKLM